MDAPTKKNPTTQASRQNPTAQPRGKLRSYANRRFGPEIIRKVFPKEMPFASFEPTSFERGLGDTGSRWDVSCDSPHEWHPWHLAAELAHHFLKFPQFSHHLLHFIEASQHGVDFGDVDTATFRNSLTTTRI